MADTSRLFWDTVRNVWLYWVPAEHVFCQTDLTRVPRVPGERVEQAPQGHWLRVYDAALVTETAIGDGGGDGDEEDEGEDEDGDDEEEDEDGDDEEEETKEAQGGGESAAVAAKLA